MCAALGFRLRPRGLLISIVTEARILEPDPNCALVLNTTDESAKRAYFESGGTDFAFTLERGLAEKNYFLRIKQNQSHTVVSSGHHRASDHRLPPPAICRALYSRRVKSSGP